jgi:drug/metabolite transporter (DMT)-like permease
MSDPAAETFRLEPPSPWGVATAFVLIYVSWGTTYKVTHLAMQNQQMPPALFGGVRVLLAGLILVGVQSWRGQAVRLTRRDFGRLLPVSICLFPMGNYFINLGQRKVDSGVAAILIATTPLWIGLLGMVWPSGERLSLRGWLGLALGFVGIVMATLPQVAGGFDFLHNYATLLVLASAASWALGSLLSRHLPTQLPHLTSAGYQMIFGGFCQSAIGSVQGEWPEMIDKTNERSIACFTYLLLVGSLTGFIAFNWLLGHISAAKVGTYAYVNPVIAVLIGFFTGEPLNWEIFAGFAVILIGVYLVRRDRLPSEEIELEPD